MRTKDQILDSIGFTMIGVNLREIIYKAMTLYAEEYYDYQKTQDLGFKKFEYEMLWGKKEEPRRNIDRLKYQQLVYDFAKYFEGCQIAKEEQPILDYVAKKHAEEFYTPDNQYLRFVSGEKIQVSHDGINWYNRTYVAFARTCWICDKPDLFGKNAGCENWKYARKVNTEQCHNYTTYEKYGFGSMEEWIEHLVKMVSELSHKLEVLENNRNKK